MEYAVIGLLNHMTNGICCDWLTKSHDQWNMP